jgi:hypothetical protein
MSVELNIQGTTSVMRRDIEENPIISVVPIKICRVPGYAFRTRLITPCTNHSSTKTHARFGDEYNAMQR